MSSSVGTAIHDEIKRNYELLGLYKSIGPAGMFAATMIQADLDAAHKALQTGDVIEIVRAYAKLKENE